MGCSFSTRHQEKCPLYAPNQSFGARFWQRGEAMAWKWESGSKEIEDDHDGQEEAWAT